MELEPAQLGGAGQLLLDGVPGARVDGDELAHRAVATVDAVQPRLVGADQVVLGVGAEAVVPGPPVRASTPPTATVTAFGFEGAASNWSQSASRW